MRTRERKKSKNEKKTEKQELEKCDAEKGEK